MGSSWLGEGTTKRGPLRRHCTRKARKPTEREIRTTEYLSHLGSPRVPTPVPWTLATPLLPRGAPRPSGRGLGHCGPLLVQTRSLTPTHSLPRCSLRCRFGAQTTQLRRGHQWSPERRSSGPRREWAVDPRLGDVESHWQRWGASGGPAPRTDWPHGSVGGVRLLFCPDLRGPPFCQFSAPRRNTLIWDGDAVPPSLDVRPGHLSNK